MENSSASMMIPVYCLVRVHHVCFINVEPLGNVKNLQVTDPTVNSLRVRWDPADGDVRQYNVIYVPVAGGASSMVIT